VATDPKRRKVISGLLFLVIGLGGISVAFGQLGNDISYLPSDVRSQPWFPWLVFWIQLGMALIMLISGAVLLLQEYRGRTK
jgi:hypothetical protein